MMFRELRRSEPLVVCLECGAGVARDEQPRHERWHAHLRKIERDSQSALLKIRRSAGRVFQ